VNFRTAARVLGGEFSGEQIVCPGPNHSARDRSLRVRIGRTGEILVHSFCGDDWRECRDYVKGKLGLREPKTAPRRPSPTRESITSSKPNNAALAVRLWREAGDIRGTLAEAYLRGRLLELPEGDCSRLMRFCPSCPFGQEWHPALIALIRNIETNAPQAVQRTALNPDGTAVKRNGKTFRMTLGPMAGGAVKIDDDADVTHGLCIGEGLETCLAAHQLDLRPVWAALGTSGIASFPVLPGIEGLTILAEAGDRSKKASKECGLRWHAAGREVIVNYSLSGSDLNDAIMRLG
jgi:putative DNA primase/helicase